jgi:hypothetical protein
MKKGNGLEKKMVKFIEEQKKTTQELIQANQELKQANEEQRKMLKEELKLKSVMFAWLKDHHVRLGFHWGEITKRAIK